MILIDTHVLIWWMKDKSRISSLAQKAIENALQTGTIFISAVSAWEVTMLIQKKRLSISIICLETTPTTP